MARALVEAQFEIMERIIARGFNHFHASKDSNGIALFDHLRSELSYLEQYVKQALNEAVEGQHG